MSDDEVEGGQHMGEKETYFLWENCGRSFPLEFFTMQYLKFTTNIILV